jgi:Shikimate 5-dehydrogenase
MHKKQSEKNLNVERFGLLGETLTYSKSPQIHQIFYNMHHLEADYKLYEVSKDDFGTEKMLSELRLLSGFNVTIPYKEVIIPYLDEIDPVAKRIGAVNTVKQINNRWIGYNTDYYGFIVSFEAELQKLKLETHKSRAIVLGSGGAAKMVVVALEDLGYNEIVVVSRNVSKIEPFFPNCRCVDYVWLNQMVLSSDVLVNCTPIGHKSIQSSELIGNTTLESQTFVFDLNYSPLMTELLIRANALNVPGCNGLFMLVAQALKAEEIWYDQKYDLKSITKSILEEI